MLSIFGRPVYKKPSENEVVLNAGVARNLSISDAIRDSYGPFVRLHLENKSGVSIAVYLNGAAVGDNSIVGATDTYFVQAGGALDITPYEDGRADKVFQRVAIVNIGAANTAAGDIVWDIQNY
jgi:hypothetical protein